MKIVFGSMFLCRLTLIIKNINDMKKIKMLEQKNKKVDFFLINISVSKMPIGKNKSMFITETARFCIFVPVVFLIEKEILPNNWREILNKEDDLDSFEKNDLAKRMREKIFINIATDRVKLRIPYDPLIVGYIGGFDYSVPADFYALGLECLIIEDEFNGLKEFQKNIKNYCNKNNLHNFFLESERLTGFLLEQESWNKEILQQYNKLLSLKDKEELNSYILPGKMEKQDDKKL